MTQQLSEQLAVMHDKHARSLSYHIENKRALRAEVDRLTAEFLARGGKIEVLDPPSPPAPKQPDEYRVTINDIEYAALSTEGAAKRAGIPRGTLQALVKRGEGPIWQKQFGGRREVLFPIPQLDVWIEQRRRGEA